MLIIVNHFFAADFKRCNDVQEHQKISLTTAGGLLRNRAFLTKIHEVELGHRESHFLPIVVR